MSCRAPGALPGCVRSAPPVQRQVLPTHPGQERAPPRCRLRPVPVPTVRPRPESASSERFRPFIADGGFSACLAGWCWGRRGPRPVGGAPVEPTGGCGDGQPALRDTHRSRTASGIRHGQGRGVARNGAHRRIQSERVVRDPLRSRRDGAVRHRPGPSDRRPGPDQGPGQSQHAESHGRPRGHLGRYGRDLPAGVVLGRAPAEGRGHRHRADRLPRLLRGGAGPAVRGGGVAGPGRQERTPRHAEPAEAGSQDSPQLPCGEDPAGFDGTRHPAVGRTRRPGIQDPGSRRTDPDRPAAFRTGLELVAEAG